MKNKSTTYKGAGYKGACSSRTTCCGSVNPPTEPNKPGNTRYGEMARKPGIAHRPFDNPHAAKPRRYL